MSEDPELSRINREIERLNSEHETLHARIAQDHVEFERLQSRHDRVHSGSREPSTQSEWNEHDQVKRELDRIRPAHEALHQQDRRIHERQAALAREYESRASYLQSQESRRSAQSSSSGRPDGYFDGQPIKVVRGATGRRDRFEFFYGGAGSPDGNGHGHVVSNDGLNIHYWRQPNSSAPVIDDHFSAERLSQHGL